MQGRAFLTLSDHSEPELGALEEHAVRASQGEVSDATLRARLIERGHDPERATEAVEWLYEAGHRTGQPSV